MCKDVERACKVLISSWRIFCHPCIFWDKPILVQMVYSCTILHSLIVYACFDGYESDLFSYVLKCIDYGMFLEEKLNEKTFFDVREAVST